MPNTSGARDDERQLCRRAGYRRRNNGDSDQERGTSAQQMIDVVASALQTRSEEAVELFLDGMNNLDGDRLGERLDCASADRPGCRPADFFEEQRTCGTFAEGEPVGTGPRGTVGARQRRAPWG